jgi:hypothetical protein
VLLKHLNVKACCSYYSYTPQDLILHGDIAYGAEEQFANEAKMAVRLANFISAFLQVSKQREEEDFRFIVWGVYQF